MMQWTPSKARLNSKRTEIRVGPIQKSDFLACCCPAQSAYIKGKTERNLALVRKAKTVWFAGRVGRANGGAAAGYVSDELQYLNCM
jgi:hypothetical protein